MSKLSMMKFTAAAFATVLSIASLAPVLHGQNTDMRSRINVPFAFELGAHHFPAGVYTIHLQSNNVVDIDGAALNGSALARWEQASNPVYTGKVVFHHYGDKYFLREVWGVGRSAYLECYPTKDENEAKKTDLAQRSAKNSGVEVALLESGK